jgi:hypothetical protein
MTRGEGRKISGDLQKIGLGALLSACLRRKAGISKGISSKPDVSMAAITGLDRSLARQTLGVDILPILAARLEAPILKDTAPKRRLVN